jgi:UDP-N-acetylmuramoyl-tripeptide--D-alanyl-D-alanine ligase
MIRTFLSFYSIKSPIYIVYMLQQVEYNPRKFLDWVERLYKHRKTLSSVVHRQKLVATPKAMALVVFLYLLVVLVIAGGFVLSNGDLIFVAANLTLLLFSLPFGLILALATVSYVAHILIIKPLERRLVATSREIFRNNKAIKIAVIGSYGKTTMKEMLFRVLEQSKSVAATPGNMNTSVSHARFAKHLTGKEEVLIVEFGEGEPGDVKRMSDTLRPDYAVITGLAPNHLDYYLTLDAVADDLLSIRKYLGKESVFVNHESKLMKPYSKNGVTSFNNSSVLGWKILDAKVSISGTTFSMKNGKRRLSIKTGLLGEHQVAPLAFVAAFADKLGLTKSEIEAGCLSIKPYEHRMQPRNIHGAWLIDDTYNGNLEGLLAGLRLLEELDATRKWYVTPGLVDQGAETERVHRKIGKAIAEANIDIVVLIDNSVRPIIEDSMTKHGFKGELRVEANPLEFYLHIEHIVAAGDVVLLQNDWTDNYN